MPWRPRTRGETLLPSREKVKEEEEGGGLSPPRFGWRRSATGAIIITAIFTNNFTAVITNSPPSMQRCNTPSPCDNLYLNMVLNAIYYFPMMYGYPMMFIIGDWYELHVLLLVLYYGALHVVQA